jgi:hypothetical protein
MALTSPSAPDARQTLILDDFDARLWRPLTSRSLDAANEMTESVALAF